MSDALRFGLFAALSLIAVAAAAQFEPPTITINSAQRSVSASARHEGGQDPQKTTHRAAGHFFERVATNLLPGEFGSDALAESSQETRIESFTVRGSGEASVGSILGSDEEGQSRASAGTEVVLNFQVPVDAPFSLSGNLALSEPGTSDGYAIVAIIGFGADGGFVHYSRVISASSPPEDGAFFFTDSLLANSAVQLTIEVSLCSGCSDEYGPASGSFVFRLDLGDRDDDGLLDEWEENGIDFDGIGPPDIDLPALGADPDIKDVFVELDVMAGVFAGRGVSFDYETMIQPVIDAFENTPGSLLEGGQEVRLHVLMDGDSPERSHLVLTAKDGALPVKFYQIKEANHGSQSDRDHAFKEEILAAKRRIFRYCLMADTFEDGLDPENPYFSGGRAETVPGNDFVVAAGQLITGFPFVHEGAIAGTFMHELGHTLGLYHGGQDAVNFKPHYLSVMNYSYSAPLFIPGIRSDTTRLFRLDYSRTGDGLALNENALLESEGVHGPSGREMFFNTSVSGETPLYVIDRADATEIDWNDNNDATEVQPYAQDLTRIWPDLTEDTYDSTLVPYSDWDKLQFDFFGPQMAGDLRGVDTDQESEPIERCLDLETIESIRAAQWIDRSLLRPLFADGFEAGDLSAWSNGR